MGLVCATTAKRTPTCNQMSPCSVERWSKYKTATNVCTKYSKGGVCHPWKYLI